MTRYLPDEAAILDLDVWETPDRLTSDEFHLEAGGDHRTGALLFDEREDDR